MKMIHLEINENIFDKVMSFLEKLPQKDIKLKIDNNNTYTKLNALSLKTKNFRFDRDEAHER